MWENSIKEYSEFMKSNDVSLDFAIWHYMESHEISIKLMGSPEKVALKYNSEKLKEYRSILEKVPKSIVDSSIGIYRRNYLNALDNLNKILDYQRVKSVEQSLI